MCSARKKGEVENLTNRRSAKDVACVISIAVERRDSSLAFFG